MKIKIYLYLLIGSLVVGCKTNHSMLYEPSNKNYWLLYANNQNVDQPIVETVCGQQSFKDDHFESWCYPLFHYYTLSDCTGVDFAASFINFESHRNRSNWRVFPFIASKGFDGCDSGYNFCLIGNNKVQPDKSEHWVYPFYSYRKDPINYDYKALFHAFRNYNYNNQTHGLRLWPFYSTSYSSEDRNIKMESDEAELLMLYSQSSYKRDKEFSILSNLGYKQRDYYREGSDKPSKEINYLLINYYDETNYRDGYIPNAPANNRQFLKSQVDTNNFMFFYERSDYIEWKTGLLTNEEMEIFEAFCRYATDYEFYREAVYKSVRNIKYDFGNDHYNIEIYEKFNFDIKLLAIEVASILKRKAVICKSNSVEDVLLSLRSFAKNNQEVQTEKKYSSPLYSYAFTKNDYNLWLILGLYRQSRISGNYQTSLAFLYDSVQDGEDVTREILSCISIDSGKNAGFSLFGNFLNIRENHGNILFFPYGEKCK